MAIATFNPDTPNGFQPVGTVYGNSWFGNIRVLPANASTSADIFRGDLVTQEATGNIEVMAASNTAGNVGVFLGISDVSLRSVANVEHPHFYDASEMTNADCMIAVAAGLLVEGQEDGIGGDPLELADVFSTVDILATGGDTTTGLSAQEIDSSEHAAVTTDPLRIIKLAQKPNNQLGDTDTSRPNARWICLCNNVVLGGVGYVAGV
jgi:hypothetical protein